MKVKKIRVADNGSSYNAIRMLSYDFQKFFVDINVRIEYHIGIN